MLKLACCQDNPVILKQNILVIHRKFLIRFIYFTVNTFKKKNSIVDSEKQELFCNFIHLCAPLNFPKTSSGLDSSIFRDTSSLQA